VTYVRLPRLIPATSPGKLAQAKAPGEVDLQAASQADATGTFHVANLPAGDYLLCASAAGYLDSCRWGLAHKVKSLAPSEQRNIPMIFLTSACILTIQIADPSGLLPKVLSAAADAAVMVGVGTAAGSFFKSNPVIGTSTWTYQVAFPFNQEVYIYIYSRTLRFADAAGNPMPTQGEKLPLRAPSGSQPSPILLKVAGKI